MVKVPGREAERVELSLRREQQRGGSFLVDNTRVAALPLAHHVDAAAAVETGS